MPAPTKKFDNVRATRMALLVFLSLTAGLGTAIFLPLGLAPQAQASQALPLAQLQEAVPLARHRSGHDGQRR